MGFVESYKHLEKLCGEVLNNEKKVSAYIDAMVEIADGALRVPGWDDDLKQLKHYRWTRNKIAHEPNCTEENMCKPADVKWVDGFYDRIMQQTDPLALYRKATSKRTAKKRTAATSTRRRRRVSKRDAGNMVFAVCTLLVILIFILLVMM